ncbi:MAG: DNA-directed DNA polymerase, partial [Bacillota bacterium]
MKISFWLLDINPKNDKSKCTTELWLWGIDSEGDRVLVVDRNFTAYFYAIVDEKSNASKIAEVIMKDYEQSIVKVEIVPRRFFGKAVVAIKVYCRVATEMGKVAKQLRSVEGISECLEDDFRAAMRYLIDNGMVPCSWHEVDAEEEQNTEGVRVAKVYAANSPTRPLENVSVPKLRVLGFSMICYSREGSPKPDRNPVIIISTATSDGEEKQFLADENKDDKGLIETFLAYICQFDPDIIVSFGANTVDWAYLKSRSRKLKIKLNFDRAKMEPHTSIYGHVSITGVVNLDLADFMDVFPEVKVKTLWNFAEHLGVMNEQHGFIEDVLFADYWDDKQNRGELCRFGLDSACKVQSTATLLLDFAMQLSGLTSLPLDHVMTAAVGFRVEWFLIKQVQRIGELVPKRIEQPYIPYVGGLVLSPKPGLHENIAVLDFKSMYPNIMITYNLSPDTYIATEESEPPSGVYKSPEVGHRFRKTPPGFYAEALTYLIRVRGTIRQRMKNLNPRTVEHRVLDARQKAVKVITNAAYGYAGWIGAKWYLKPVAEAASAWGRQTILAAEKMARDARIEVVYGDTDSLFLGYDQDRIEKLRGQIKQELKLDVEVGEVYKRIFFTEAKKRYAGLRQDGSLDIVGLEVIRGDWADVAKKVQEHVLEIILKEQSAKNAIAYVRSVIIDLKQNKVPLHDLIIWKTLTKAPDEYAIKAPHVEAAKMLKEKGWRLTGGDKVGYVILVGKGRLYNRVKPYVFAKLEEIDVEYYITNQVLPAA